MPNPVTVADIPAQSTVDSTDKIFTVKADGVSRLSTVAAVKSAVQATLPATGVTPGSYTNANFTVAADGRISVASNGTASSGSGTAPAAAPTPLAAVGTSGTVKIDVASADPVVYLKSSVDSAFATKAYADAAKTYADNTFVSKANADLGGRKLIVSATKPDGATGSYIWFDTVSATFWLNTDATTWLGTAEQIVRVSILNAATSSNSFINTTLWDNVNATCRVRSLDLAFQDYTGYLADNTVCWKVQLIHVGSNGAEAILQEQIMVPGGTGWNNQRIDVSKTIPLASKLWGIKLVKVGAPGSINYGCATFITRPILVP